MCQGSRLGLHGSSGTTRGWYPRGHEMTPLSTTEEVFPKGAVRRGVREERRGNTSESSSNSRFSTIPGHYSEESVRPFSPGR